MQTKETSPAPNALPERRHDIDWLRLMAVFLLFFFHSGRIFDVRKNFYVQNDQLSRGISDAIVRGLEPWQMGLFFLLAGASTYYALRGRSGGQYVGERFKRLVVPFIFGVLVLIPPQSYLGLLHHAGSAAPFPEWFPKFFVLQDEDMDGYFLGGHTWGHLWFIIHLFVYSLLLAGPLLWLNGQSGQRLISKLAAAFALPGVLFVIPIPLGMTRLLPDIAGGNPVFYLAMFLWGYVLVSHPRFGETIDGHRVVLLFLGPAAFAALLVAAGDESFVATLPEWLTEVAEFYIGSFVTWFLILALVAYGRRLLDFTNGFLRYFAEASYPLYILHQTVIVVVGYYVVRADTAVPVKYAAIVVGSFAVSVLAYDLAVRRSNLTRFLFGMKPRVR